MVVWMGNFACEYVESVGCSSGLITCWDICFISIEKVIKGTCYFLLVWNINGTNTQVGFANVYAHNVDEDRALLWEELIDVMSGFLADWCVGGDFNVVLKAN